MESDSMELENQIPTITCVLNETSKPKSSADEEELEEELELGDVCNASESGRSSSSPSSEENLIKQFNESIGFTTSVGAVARFYLEMCGNDLDTAVTMFKDSLDESPVLRCHSSQKSGDARPSDSPATWSMQPGRKVLDVAESPRITAPPIHRTNHSIYRKSSPSVQPAAVASHSLRQLRPLTRQSSRDASSMFSHRRVSAPVQIPDQRRPARWSRSQSERYVSNASPITHHTCHSLPLRSTSNDTHLQQLYLAAKNLGDNQSSPVMSARPPTAPEDYQPNMPKRLTSWNSSQNHSGRCNPAA